MGKVDYCFSTTSMSCVKDNCILGFFFLSAVSICESSVLLKAIPFSDEGSFVAFVMMKYTSLQAATRFAAKANNSSKLFAR